MDDRVRDLIENGAQTIVGLDVILFYQANPSTFDTPLGIALRTHRSLNEVEPALERLAEGGILERHTRGDGKYTCYALSKDLTVWNLLCLVSEAYIDNPEQRKEIVRMLIRRQQAQRLSGDRKLAPGGETL